MIIYLLIFSPLLIVKQINIIIVSYMETLTG